MSILRPSGEGLKGQGMRGHVTVQSCRKLVPIIVNSTLLFTCISRPALPIVIPCVKFTLGTDQVDLDGQDYFMPDPLTCV